tara:strand:- start:66 stop:206 length:141 start_codon:yes stop_codon:yes gene_type:complete
MGFTTWHKSILQKTRKTTGLNDYQLLWIAFLKGVLIGGLVVYFYMR